MTMYGMTSEHGDSWGRGMSVDVTVEMMEEEGDLKIDKTAASRRRKAVPRITSSRNNNDQATFKYTLV